MRRLRPFMLIGIALIAAIGSSTFVYRWLTAKAAEATSGAPVEMVVQQTDLQSIVVADADLEWGTPITEEMIALVPFPKDYLPDGHYVAAEDVVGRVSIVGMRRNEPILDSKLAPEDQTTGGVAAVMDAQMRAMAVRVDDEIGVAGFIKPGDRVDVMVALKTQGENNDNPTAKLVLGFRRVLAIGTEMVRVGKEDEPRPVRVITLEVSAEEGEKLALAATQGKFRLALRHPLDDSKTLTRGATLESLLASNKLGGGPQKKGKRSGVQLIKGTEITEVSF
ncbi:MAG: pilus assembly protein CpaB [Hyphomicrobiaceae bacterium]|jgi:pilus assembly protein CpaB